MANRYWVGGTAGWDATAGTKWSLTSGGTGGEAVPTVNDDVFFDANSGTGTITIYNGAVCKSINFTGFTGTVNAGGQPSYPYYGYLSVAGNVTIVAGMTWNYNGQNGRLKMTGTGTLITAGKLMGPFEVNGAGITVTLGDAFSNFDKEVWVLQGTLNTANYNISCAQFISNGSSTRTLTLGSSTITAIGNDYVFDMSGSNLTVNPGTSLLNFTGTTANPRFHLGSKSWYDFTITHGERWENSYGARIIYGDNAFRNLRVPAVTTHGDGYFFLGLGGNQTVSGTLTVSGSTYAKRCFITSDVYGTARTLTVNTLSAPDTDFRDITLTGVAINTAPTRAGDCGGNSGITFPAAKTVYRVGTNTTWQGSSSWATTSSGTGSDTNFPLAQDTAVIDNNTTLSGTLSTGPYQYGTIDCSNRTNTITLSFAAFMYMHGSLKLGTGVTPSGTNAVYFLGRGATDTISCAGKTLTCYIDINKLNAGTCAFNDAFSSSNGLVLSLGTLETNNYNVLANYLSSYNTNTRTIRMGTGTWTLSGTGALWSVNATNLTITTADIILSDNTTTTRQFAHYGNASFKKLTIGGNTSTSITQIGINNTQTLSFTELASTKTVAHTVQLLNNIGTITTWNIAGTAGNIVTFNSNVAGTRRNFTLTNATSAITNDYLSIKDIGETSGGKFFVGENSINGGNNNNIIFPSQSNSSSMLFMFF